MILSTRPFFEYDKQHYPHYSCSVSVQLYCGTLITTYRHWAKEDEKPMPNTLAYQNTIQELYIAYYGRPADPQGLSYWSYSLQNSSGDLNSVVGLFGNSDEFLDRFSEYNNSDLIDTVYYQLFARFPDESGKQYYLHNLNHGHMSLQSIVVNILDGATGNDRAIIDNKVVVSNYFLEHLELGNFDYRGNHAADMAKSLLDQITLDTISGLSQVDSLLGIETIPVGEGPLDVIDEYWFVEGGDSLSFATDIEDLTTIDGSAGFGSDSGDYFHFTASEDGTYYTELVTPNGELYVELRDTWGDLLTTTVNESDSEIDILSGELLAGEDFYLVVKPYADEASNYSVTTWLEPYGASEEYLQDSYYLGDAANYLDGASYIAELNTWISGSVGFDWDDADYFYFQPEHTGYLEIELSGLNEDLDLALYDFYGNAIQLSDHSGESNELIVEWLYEDQLYFVEVFGYDNNASDYSLDLWYV
ncbi:MAG: hypothetical protein ACI92E_002074 [Oceanicoccus sp.]|jgi:hypothetical protein